MGKALDEKFVDEFKTLEINEKGSGFLYVQLEEWTNLLYRLERLGNLGCIFYGFVVAVILIASVIEEGFIFFIVALALGTIYKSFIIRRYKHLHAWGQYQYEIFGDRMVRYSNSKYNRYVFKEFDRIRHYAFGSVMTKGTSFRCFFLYPGNKAVLVIPKSLQGYQQIIEYAEGAIKQK